MPIDPRTARRRLVSFTTLADISRDLDVLEAAQARGSLKALGNHPPGALLDHLARTMQWSLDGFPHKAPWLLRQVGPFFKKRMLAKPFSPGIKLGKKVDARVWDDAMPFDRVLPELRAQITRFDKSGGPAATSVPHPVFGSMTLEDWRTYHLRHAELHLSFLSV